jgi:hypothetical protein
MKANHLENRTAEIDVSERMKESIVKFGERANKTAVTPVK